MPTDYDPILNEIIQAATSGPQNGMAGRLSPIIRRNNDPVAVVLAMGALAYSRAKDDPLAAEEVTALKDWSALANRLAGSNPATPETMMAKSGGMLFAIVARQAAGEKIPPREQRDTVRSARRLADSVARSSGSDLLVLLSAAVYRFFPLTLRDRQGADKGATDLNRFIHHNGATGVLARLLFTNHLWRRGNIKQLGPVVGQLSRDLPHAVCVQGMQAVVSKVTSK